jgi:hypothetical protein
MQILPRLYHHRTLLPTRTVPQPILFEILHGAIDESPAKAKCFPQALWGIWDLSVRARSVLPLSHLVSDVGDNRNR